MKKQREESKFTAVGDIFKRFDPMRDKYISREFQAFGCMLADKLHDEKHKSLYIKLAKTLPRPALESAYRFAVDSTTGQKGALFMWKLKELGVLKGKKKPAEQAPTQAE